MECDDGMGWNDGSMGWHGMIYAPQVTIQTPCTSIQLGREDGRTVTIHIA
jgi:hypothetical protein